MAASAGDIPALVRCLRGGSAVRQRQALAALVTAAEASAEACHAAVDAGGLPLLVRLCSGKAAMQEGAASALFHICALPDLHPHLIAAGAVPALVAALRS